MFTKSKIVVPILAAFLALGIFAGNAYATNGHQDHQGACARSTTSISEGVSDLKFNGVLETFANAVGIHGFDGSLTKQMDEQLVIGKIAKAVDTENTGCDGAGGIFDAGIRHLYKGEEVALKAPAKFGKEVCRHPSANCKKIRITVHVVFPLSCWNKNHEVTIEVFIWIRKPHHHHHKHHPHHHHKHHHKCGCVKTPPPPPGGNCNGNNVNNGTGSAGNCNICTGVNVCNENNEPPCKCTTEEPKEPPTIKNVYKIQEVKTNEEIQFYSDLYAPSGDEVVLTFETEYGKFTPEKFVVPSYGAKSHFVTTYKAPSEALTDEVCVTALDKTTGKEAIPQCQLVEVQAVSEPPS
jgi:hypothetical protein